MAPLPTCFCAPLRKRMTPRGYILNRSLSEAARAWQKKKHTAKQIVSAKKKKRSKRKKKIFVVG